MFNYRESLDLIKAELCEGRGVSIGLQISSGSINYDTWAVYCEEYLGRDHVACIVGWDDNYSASNFLNTPPGDGAWIVKNSWGSQTDAVPGGIVAADGTTKNANESEWGIVDENGMHTGYFYLSYYDGTIGVPESFAFQIKENNDQRDALQLDYMPASVVEWSHTDENPMWEANIFTLDKDMRIDEVATRIRMSESVPVTGFTVRFDLYRLREGAAEPDDGELISTAVRTFENQGYHRTSLDAPVYLKAGDRLGIVVQQTHICGNGTTVYGAEAQEADSYRNIHSDPVYGTPVINEGESFWKLTGVTDLEEEAQDGWLDMTAPLSEELLLYLKPDISDNPSMAQFYFSRYCGHPINDFFDIDNFCIKAFGEPGTPEDDKPTKPEPADKDPEEEPARPDHGDTDWIFGSLAAGRKFNPPEKDGAPVKNDFAGDETVAEPVPETPVKTAPEAEALPFTDVTTGAPFFGDIAYVCDNGLMNGVSGTEFAPYDTLTRAMVVTILYRMEGEPEVAYSGTFTDVPDGKWYTDGVEWAAENGIVNGYGNGQFGPTDEVTREQFAAILYRYAGFKGYDVCIDENTNYLSYNDVFDIAEYARLPMFWAIENDMILDTDGDLRPAEAALRWEVAAAIRAFCENAAK